ncbi:MAG: YitT family protein [Fermentimonas sp.]|jgi:uncharacterized membrane-anchored protein YitT (DUF2179 family)
MAQRSDYSIDKFYFKDFLTMLLGTFMYALGVTQFIMPHKFVLGGLTGIALLLNYAFHLPVSVMVFVLNIILLLLSLKILGKQFLIRTLVCVASLSGFLAIFEALKLEPIMMNEPLIAGLIGAIIAGSGIGLVLSVNSSTGGTDIIILIISKYRNVTPGRMMLYIDIIIVSTSYLIFRSIETIVFGIIIIAVMSTSVDWILNGIRQSVQFIIISKKYEEIATQVNLQLKRGCTVLDGIGWYTKKEQKVLLIMAKRTESNSIFRLVKSIDHDAFVSQTNVVGVYGQGFDKIK